MVSKVYPRCATRKSCVSSPLYLLLLRLSVSGHVGASRALATVGNAAVKVNMQVYRCLFPIILGVQAPHPIFF